MNKIREYYTTLKRFAIGKAHNPYDSKLFMDISLIPLFAWIGLGADGLSSSSYGPSESFVTLGGHVYLSLFVALATAITIFIISASYSQIIELFPTGGGGYLVASKLISPNVGMVSGCALLVDYVLTISVSVASGADAIFSFLPPGLQLFKLEFAIAVILVLIVLNLRGVKESIIVLAPIFAVFLITHIIGIVYGIGMNLTNLPPLIHATRNEVSTSYSQLGFIGMFILIMRSYSMGAGTYTGIEAVSNGLPVIREPRVHNAKKTMSYMALSLAFTAFGLMLAYLLYNVHPQFGKTLNAVLFENMTKNWGTSGIVFAFITLFSEAALLFVAAQTGFIDGPRVISNMSLDRWFPGHFSLLSDRFVNKNGIVIMGLSSLAIMILAHGSVQFLVVLYSINVFITFSLSQFGMVKHWWQVRTKAGGWKRKIFINGIGFTLTMFILISMIVIKFYDGGWITLFITGALVLFAAIIKRHYNNTGKLLTRLNSLVAVVDLQMPEAVSGESCMANPKTDFDKNDKTAILLVNGFNGLGLHTLFAVIRLFGSSFKNFIFLEVGMIDSGNFKGEEEIEKLESKVKCDINKYVNYMRQSGYQSDGIGLIGTDIIEELNKVTPNLLESFPNAVFFGGQLVFPEDTLFLRLLHNNVVFSIQRKFYTQGIPFVLLPIKVVT
jgi:amino acid transporter